MEPPKNISFPKKRNRRARSIKLSETVQFKGEIVGRHPHGLGLAIQKGDCDESCVPKKSIWRRKKKSLVCDKHASSNFYDGEWTMGIPDGVGAYSYANGSGFVGAISAGFFHGDGVYVWENGSQFEGEWVMGKMQGKGLKIWSNGAKYEGEWKNDKPHGEGTYTWENGEYRIYACTSNFQLA
eukprot:TRINITY_DN18895_c0_g3_i3.p1 TRINITY_DN18895_c0_g3~~TRINITY_DN18895_c0_g3_i3.p1  ORF type:complete len:182 (+),score=37.89 TRINITY_DN18895_c0_g3_i3:40-585(+)